MNKTIITGLVFFSICLNTAPLWAQLNSASEHKVNPEEDIIGGIGGTGIRSMNRPDILERPDQLERPELLESREALEDLLELDSAKDTATEDVEIPERPETN